MKPVWVCVADWNQFLCLVINKQINIFYQVPVKYHEQDNNGRLIPKNTERNVAVMILNKPKEGDDFRVSFIPVSPAHSDSVHVPTGLIER